MLSLPALILSNRSKHVAIRPPRHSRVSGNTFLSLRGVQRRSNPSSCHCEERSDVTIASFEFRILNLFRIYFLEFRVWRVCGVSGD
jgi:hypothetical protein